MNMRNLDQNTITDSTLERISDCENSRLKQVIASLIRHLHEFAREVSLTPEEWRAGIDFLTAAGHVTDDKRQEFILLSDTLGLSALVDLIAHSGKSAPATESSLLGPFYREGAPQMALGSDIGGETPGERIVIRGHVRSADGKPLAGATLDVWQAAPTGLYDLQDPKLRGMNLRARLRTGADGEFQFLSVKPASYPVPHDGPVGAMLLSLGRHPYRPAHIHFIASAPGHRKLVTALYIAGDPYLESDAVFGARDGLVVDYSHGANGVPDSINFDFVLEPDEQAAR